jgi:hypothetical protein
VATLSGKPFLHHPLGHDPTKLTDAKLQGLKAPEKGRAEHSDSDVPGLRVRVGASGAKTFILRKRVGEKIHNIAVGRYGPRFGLADARKKGPIAHQRSRSRKASPYTFESVQHESRNHPIDDACLLAQ